MRTLLLCCCMLVWGPKALAEPLSPWKYQIGGYAITVQAANPKEPVIEVTGPNPEGVSSFFLAEPSRFVMDIPEVTDKPISESVEISQSTLIQRVRIASHPNRTRLVFDLSSQQKPLLQTTSFEKNILFALSATAEQPEMAPLSTLRASANLQSDTFPDTVGSHSQSERAVVTGVQFVRLSPSQEGVVRVQLSDARPFELTQMGDGAYKLTIRDVEVEGPHVLKSLYAPQDFASFLLLKPHQESDSISFTIGVPAGVQLEARPKKSAIWIRGRGIE